MASELLRQIEGLGLVPVIKIDKPEHAVPLARALAEGDIPIAEVTFRTDAALKSIKAIAAEVPEVTLGAGTVLTPVQAAEAHSAGAKFIVSPGFNPKVVDYCVQNGVFVLPGINSPTQIEQALEMGISTVKFFPAEASGGVAMLKAMSAPYGTVRFVPTGGIGPDNLRTYLDFTKVVACGGSWMVPPDAISRGDFSTVTSVARQAVSSMLGFRVSGVRLFGPQTTRSRGAELSTLLFGFGPVPVDFAPAAEHDESPDIRGEITLATKDVSRSLYYLERKGIVPLGGGVRSGIGARAGSGAGSGARTPAGQERIVLDAGLDGYRLVLATAPEKG